MRAMRGPRTRGVKFPAGLMVGGVTAGATGGRAGVGLMSGRLRGRGLAGRSGSPRMV